MSLEYVPDHLDRAREAWLSQDRDKARLSALLAAGIAPVQEMEDRIFDLYSSTPLDVATGEMLDMWGRILGEGREGADDASYRNFLLVRLLILISGGTDSEVFEIWSQLVQPAVQVDAFDLFPAAQRLTVVRETPLSDATRARIARFMELARPAGIAFDLSEAVSAAPADVLRLQNTEPTFDGPTFSRRF